MKTSEKAGVNREEDYVNISTLKRFEKALMKGCDTSAAGLDLTFNQERTLLILDDGTADTMTELTRHVGLEKGSFTALTDSLEQKKLVERTNCESDRRKVILKLTPAGREAVNALRAVFRSNIDRHLSVLSEKEQKELKQALKIIAECTKKL